MSIMNKTNKINKNKKKIREKIKTSKREKVKM